jgi:hypothetical protein
LTRDRIVHALFGLLFAATCAQPGGASVLCFGADGHVQIESAAAPCCDRDTAPPTEPCARSAQQIGSRDFGAEGCGGCKDVPIAQALERRRSDAPLDLEPLCAAALSVLHPFAAVLDSLLDSASTAPRPCGRPSTILELLRSVVLRC